MPEFDGGNIEMRFWLNSKLYYPEKARDAEVQGKISASFVVTDSGTIRNIQLENTLGYGCDEAVMEMLGKMPKWKCGFENDVAVDVKIVLPIVFSLDDSEFLYFGLVLLKYISFECSSYHWSVSFSLQISKFLCLVSTSIFSISSLPLFSVNCPIILPLIGLSPLYHI